MPTKKSNAAKSQENAAPTEKQISPYIQKELKRLTGNKNVLPSSYWTKGKDHQATSTFFEPHSIGENGFSHLRTVNRARYGSINCRTLRNVAQKAWIINICINYLIKKCKPYFTYSTDNNKRGFILLKNGEPLKDNGKNAKEAKEIADFLKNTGNYKDSGRDSLVKYCTKLLRDEFTMDQIATELQRNAKGELIAFFAVDAATIEKVIPDELNPTDIKFLQIIDGVPCAAYTDNEMIFDFKNPRTDIYHSFYGYSEVEQVIDLITSEINAFTYNAGNFTENKLPRGMLLIEGDASPETITEMEDYIAEIMSGGPLNQWRIPIIPSGQAKGEGGGIKYQELNGKNRDMEFSQWLDFLTSAVVATFGCSMDELGIQSQKSQNLFERTGNAQMTESKSMVLGDTLSFLQDYLNKIVEQINPEYTLEFVGYEIPDPKVISDLDKSETESWKTLNEKREEKGFKKLDADWADIPLNPQAVQCFQAAQANSQMGGGDMGDDAGDESWANYGDMQMGDDMGEGETDSQDIADSFDVPDSDAEAQDNINAAEETKKSLLIKKSFKI